ncbi:MAG: exonuclease SbcCD subunit D [Syntrophobacteraceae bacterium]
MLEVQGPNYKGIAFIGDPHIAAFPPGHRLDDYTKTVLDKLSFCLDVARDRNCLTIILGDLFHVPRNNPNHLIVDLIELFREAKPWVLVGNHDKYEARLTRDVSLSVLDAAGAIHLLAQPGPVASVSIQGQKVLIGASPDWTPIPKEVEKGDNDFVIWLTHHDLVLPGYESGRFRLADLPGVDLVVNGHIHTAKPPQKCGKTTWLNPGSIVRITRSAHTRAMKPAISLWRPGCEEMEIVEVPHAEFDRVFPALNEEWEDEPAESDESLFIKGLENLSLRKTTEGVGLRTFLEANLNSDDSVDRIVWQLYEEVMADGTE